MNSAEAMMLRPEAARQYLVEVYTKLTENYAEVAPIEIVGLIADINESVQGIDAGDYDPGNELSLFIDQLDDLDCDDYFGTQGWRYFLMGED